MEFPVEFKHTGRGHVWTWRARLAGAGPGAQAWRDSVRTTLNGRSPDAAPLGGGRTCAAVDARAADDLLGKINPELMEGEDGIIQVSLSTSRLSELREGVDELLHYPYGCVEQTTSSLLAVAGAEGFSATPARTCATPRRKRRTPWPAASTSCCRCRPNPADWPTGRT